MNNLASNCIALNDLSSFLLENILTDAFVIDVISFCNSNLLDVHTMLKNGWWNVPHACFINKIIDADDEKIMQHIAKVKDMLMSTIRRNFVYDRFINYEMIDHKKIFAHGKKKLRLMIKIITCDIITSQICAEGVIYYEPKVISMCLCMYISDLYVGGGRKNFSRRLQLEKLFKKYNERRYSDIKLSDFDKVIFANKCDTDLTSFGSNVLLSYNMDTYRRSKKHNVYIEKVLKIIKNHVNVTHMICLYEYFPSINNDIYMSWLLRKTIRLPHELVSIIIRIIVTLSI